MNYLDCYARAKGQKGFIDGFPEVTFAIDVEEPQRTKIITQLSKYFGELREVTETNGQAISDISSMAEHLDDGVGVPRAEGPGQINLLVNL